MKKLIVVLVVLFISGCSRVQMSPPYRQTVTMSAISVSELNRRCQDGDNQACKEGLSAASKTLNLIVDALEGRYDD